MRRCLLLLCLGLLACAPSALRSNASPPGAVSLDDLTTRERRDWNEYMQQFQAPCPNVTQSLAECMQSAPASCRACEGAARFLVAEIRSGRTHKQIEAAFHTRFDPDQIKPVDLSGAPAQGPANAPVTVVEFADFQCPYCAMAVQILDKLRQIYGDQVRVVFMNFPLASHPQAELAAKASMAAHKQGKFWPMHHKMFENQSAIGRADLERYAQELGLNMVQFRADIDSAEVAEMVRKSRAQGSTLAIPGTPTFFINGREFKTGQFEFGGEELLNWIDLEIEMVTGKAAQHTSGS